MSNGTARQTTVDLRRALAGVRRVVLTAHVDPDPDALGSALGLYNVLRREGWDALPVCVGHVPSFAPSLPGSEAIVRFPSRMEDAQDAPPVLEPGDALVVCDTPVAARMGAFYEVHRDQLAQCQVLVFDHHYTNDDFGTVNVVDPTAAATAEVICETLDASGMPLDQDSASCLMLALFGDTQTFRTENSTPRSINWAYRLAEAGAPIFQTSQLLFKTRSLSSIRLWGAALELLQISDGVLWTTVTRAMLEAADATMEDTEGLVDFLLSGQDVRVAIVLKEEVPGETKVSMRTVPGVDATRIVGAFGGGGHQRAAGCTIFAPPAEAAQQLLPRVEAEVAGATPGAA